MGEYITIYQYQRQQQRKHLEEKERQLQIVSRDREDLKAKLSQLQHLVTSFVQDGPKVDNHSVPQQLQQQRRRQELQQNVERVGPQLNGAASSDNGQLLFLLLLLDKQKSIPWLNECIISRSFKS